MIGKNYDCLLWRFAVLSVEEYTAISVLDITAWAREIEREKYTGNGPDESIHYLLWRFAVLSSEEYCCIPARDILYWHRKWVWRRRVGSRDDK